MDAFDSIINIAEDCSIVNSTNKYAYRILEFKKYLMKMIPHVHVCFSLRIQSLYLIPMHSNLIVLLLAGSA